jgi:hypothetical protein
MDFRIQCLSIYTTDPPASRISGSRHGDYAERTRMTTRSSSSLRPGAQRTVSYLI